MNENPFDKACRHLPKLEPVAMLAWLLAFDSSEFEFVRWIDARRLSLIIIGTPFPPPRR